MEEKEQVTNAEVEATEQETEVESNDISENELGDFDKEAEGVEEPKKADNPPEAKPKKQQTQEESAYFARMRKENRELKQRMAQMEQEAKKAKFDAKASTFSEDALSELGIDKIETEDDMLLAESYKEAMKKGSTNPVADAYKALRTKQSKELQEAKDKSTAEEENKRRVSEDQAAFKKAYGIDTKEALKDERFTKMYGKFITYGNLTELYGMYSENILKPEKAQKEIEEKAKSMGSIPSSNGGSTDSNGNFDPWRDLHGKDWLDWANKNLRNH